MVGALRLMLAAVAVVAVSCAGWAQEKPLRVILLPFTNTMSLMELYQPLRTHLQTALGRPVHLFTAADFTTHFRNVRDRDYDLAITGPHFGAWAVAHGAVPVLRYAPTLKPVLVVRADGAITTPEQLRGKVVTLSNRLSVSSITGEAWLARLGLHAGSDYRLTESPTHTTAIMAVVMGEADGAITTHTPVRQAPEDVRKAIRVIESPSGVPHLFTLANPALPTDEVARIKAALLDFAQTDSGKAFLARSGYQGYRDISEQDLEVLQGPVNLLQAIVPESAQ